MKATILEHDIYYSLQCDKDLELNEWDINHIEQCIKDGIHQGEICTEDAETKEEVWGWWEIVSWKDIACELYHAVNILDEERKNKAIERFNKYW